MTSQSDSDAPLSPHWAFVVQFREGTALTPEALHGRVEHIVSGQATRFTSLEELWAFMARVVSSLLRPPHPSPLLHGAREDQELHGPGHGR
jgi:hypothetical protein